MIELTRFTIRYKYHRENLRKYFDNIFESIIETDKLSKVNVILSSKILQLRFKRGEKINLHRYNMGMDS